MGKLAIQIFLTLDGVMQGPGGPEEDPSGGFEHGGWSVNYWDEDVMPKEIERSIGQAAAFLLGRTTYEIFIGHWPRVPDDDPVGGPLNRLPKYVASTTLEAVDWRNSTLIRNVPEDVARLKREVDGELQVVGSHGLIQSLLEHDLVDELRLWTFPLVLGTGKRLFGQGTRPANLRLVDTKTATTGVEIQTFEAAGTPEYGSFELEE